MNEGEAMKATNRKSGLLRMANPALLIRGLAPDDFQSFAIIMV